MVNDNEKNNYRKNLKNTSVLGGVQVITILISILRSKFVAILLGAEGMGIQGLLTSTTSTITSFTSFGLSTSAVKDIAQAEATKDQYKISRVITVFRRLVFFTGLLGTLICLFFASGLSVVTFGNTDYTISFVCLSITLLFVQLTSGQTTLLQGLRRLNYVAKTTLFGSVLGLVISIPLYYWGGMKAIVPVMIIASFVSLLLSWLYSRKIKVEPISLSLKDTVKTGKGMLRMGFFLGLQNSLSVLSAYFVRVFIGHIGGIAEVGLYVAGFTIVNTYVGLIFTAMGTEYYPRLSTLVNDKDKFNTAINQQMEISILLLSPIVVLFIVFADLGIILLYSESFLSISSMVYLTILGMFFRAPSWCIAFSFLCKGDAHAYFISELCAIIYTTILNLIFYKYWGLLGMGMSFLLIYMIYWTQVYCITFKRYKFRVSKAFWKLYFPHFGLSVLSVILVFVSSGILKYSIGCFFLIASFLFSFISLDKRVGVIDFIKSKINQR